jgi:hypothetical protein
MNATECTPIDAQLGTVTPLDINNSARPAKYGQLSPCTLIS